jgi:hypothetical protein
MSFRHLFRVISELSGSLPQLFQCLDPVLKLEWAFITSYFPNPEH